MTAALVLATTLALFRVLRGVLRFDAIDGDFSLAMVFLIVGLWLLTSQHRERRNRGAHR